MPGKPKFVSKVDIYIDCRRLLDSILDVTPGFPREYKYTVGADMHHLAITVMDEIAAAYLTHDKEERKKHLDIFLAKFETLKTLIRIAGEREWIKGIHKHAAIIEITNSIGKQAAGWKKSLGNQDNNYRPEPGS